MAKKNEENLNNEEEKLPVEQQPENEEYSAEEVEKNENEEKAADNKTSTYVDEKKAEEIERKSYSKLSYKNLTRMRAKAAEYGKEIPYLKYELTGDRSSTLSLKILTILTSIIVAFAAGLLIYGCIELSKILFEGATETSSNLSKISKIPFLDLFGAATTGFMWVIAIAVPLLALAVLIFCANFLYSLIKINCYTAEEKAVGHHLGSVKLSAIILGSTLVVMAIALLIIAGVKAVIPSVILLVIAAYAFSLFAVLQAQRNKAKEWFSTLPEERQADFIEHNKAIKDLKRLKSNEKSLRKDTSIFGRKGKFGLLYILLHLTYEFADARIIYNNLKNNEKYRNISTGLGWRAFYRWVTYAAITLVSCIVFYLMQSQEDSGLFFVIIFIIILISLLLYSLILLPQALNLSIKQIVLNKKFIGWLSLILTVLTVVAEIALFILISQV